MSKIYRTRTSRSRRHALAGHEVPAGWYRVGNEGSKEECSAYVDEVWTDMRPRSLRERMEGTTRS